MPVTVRSTPAAAVAATPLAPRIRTAAAGPVLGPIGSWPTVNITIRRAMASKMEMFTPIACSISQLRATWAHTASTANVIRRPRLLMRRIASPAQSPV